MNLYVIRHGETLWNKEKRIQGHSDSPLTKVGIKQAELTAKVLKNIKFTKVLCSDLGRAQSTSQILLKPNTYFNKNNGELILNTKLRERSFGVWEGLTHEEINTKNNNLNTTKLFSDIDFKPEGGESKNEVLNRLKELLYNEIIPETEQTISTNKEINYLLVTHGGIINTLVKHVLEIPADRPRKFLINNCAINILEVINDKAGNNIMLKTLGDISHLAKTNDELKI